MMACGYINIGQSNFEFNIRNIYLIIIFNKNIYKEMATKGPWRQNVHRGNFFTRRFAGESATSHVTADSVSN